MFIYLLDVNNAIDSILHDQALNSDIQKLPNNYNFEIHKTIWRIQSLKAKKIALQLPEGLAIFACTISDVIEDYFLRNKIFDEIGERFYVEILIMGDVTYGACCIDDYSAKSLGVNLLIHYGHSCLVPSQNLESFDCCNKAFNVLYVFVDITFDTKHLIDTIMLNFPPQINVYIGATVQFIASLPFIIDVLQRDYFLKYSTHEPHGKIDFIPRTSPLSKGEVLGCTAPTFPSRFSDIDSCLVIIFVADGRFHLEALMIANPHLADHFYLYNPYDKKLTSEHYDHVGTLKDRNAAVSISVAHCLKSFKKPTELSEQNFEIDTDFKITTKNSTKCITTIGFILGTLGRQGSPVVIDHLISRVHKLNSHFDIQYLTALISEISPEKLKCFSKDNDGIDYKTSSPDFWVQVGCPRLSIDWGQATFGSNPLLNPFEFNMVCKICEDIIYNRSNNLPNVNGLIEDYPMDYYAYDSSGPWTPAHRPKKN
ncbi:unnamed protein product [Gordionus sp. m RMFG-2023]